MYYVKSNPPRSKFSSHTLFVIYYFHQGVGNYIIGNQNYVLEPGDLIIMHGLTLNCANINPNFPYIRTVINFHPDYVRNTTDKLFSLNVLECFDQLKNYRYRLRGEERKQFEQHLLKMHQYYAQNNEVADHRYLLAFFELLLMINDLSNQYCAKMGGLVPKKDRLVREIIDYVEKHYMEDFSMEHLSKELHFNKHYLARTFREVTGTTIFNYVNQRRINEAKVSVQLGKLQSITDICYKVGFKNSSHFSRVFKQLVGCTPYQYRMWAQDLVSNTYPGEW